MYLAGCILSLGNSAAGLSLTESGNFILSITKSLLLFFYLQEEPPSILTYNLADWSRVILSLSQASCGKDWPLRHKSLVKRKISDFLWLWELPRFKEKC